MFRRLLGFSVLGAALLALVVGCSSNNTVEVLVTLDGQPLEGATVSLIPEDANLPSASGLTDAAGKCKLTAGSKTGVPAGKYKPTVVKTEMPSGMDEALGTSNPTDAMKKMDQNKGKGGPPSGPPRAGGPSGMMPKSGSGAASGPATKNSAPARYKNPNDKNPLPSVTVPTSGVVTLALDSK